MGRDTAIEQKIYELAKKYGKNPSKLSSMEYTQLSLLARESMKEKASAAVAAGASILKTKFLNIRVSEEKANQNASICRNCPDGKFKTLDDGMPSCGACGCSGRFLQSKWMDKTQKCPNGHWDNTAEDAGK